MNQNEPELSPLVKQVGGNHYKNLEYQPIEFLMDTNLNASLGYAIKYLSRYPNKNTDDLEKARHCIEIFDEWYRSNEDPYVGMVDTPKLIKFTSQFEPVIQQAMLHILNLVCDKYYEYSEEIDEVVFCELSFQEAILKALDSIEKVNKIITPF